MEHSKADYFLLLQTDLCVPITAGRATGCWTKHGGLSSGCCWGAICRNLKTLDLAVTQLSGNGPNQMLVSLDVEVS